MIGGGLSICCISSNRLLRVVSPPGEGLEEIEDRRRMAALTNEEWIAKLTPDLQGLLDSRKVAKELQAGLAKNAIDSIPMLSAVAIDRAGLMVVAKDLLGLDVASGGDEIIRFAQLYLAWQSASKRIKVQDEMDAESSVHKEPKPVPAQELQSLRTKRQRFQPEDLWKIYLSSWMEES